MEERFMAALDERLMDLVTCRDGDRMLTVSEYQRWERTRTLEHVRNVRVVQDAVAAAYQDTVVPRTPATYAAALYALRMDGIEGTSATSNEQ